MFDLLRQGYDTRANIEANLDKLVPLELVITTDTNEILYKDTQGNLITPTAREVLDMLNDFSLELDKKANLSGADFTGEIRALHTKIQRGSVNMNVGVNEGSDFGYLLTNNGTQLSMLADRVEFNKPVFAEGLDLKGIMSKNPNGYVKFANGLILQWGFIDTSGDFSSNGVRYSSGSATFPVAFSIAPTITLGSSFREFGASLSSRNNISFGIQCPNFANVFQGQPRVYWIAIGY